VRDGRRLALATLVAIVLSTPAGRSAWGHTFPPVRTVVLQIESCEVAMMVGYRAGSREEADALVARVASRPKSQARDAMRDILASHAMAPLALAVDGKALVPTTVRAKLGTDAPKGRPMVVLLVTYALPAGKTLALSSRDPRTTRISWTDRGSARIDLEAAPAQGKFFTGVASFLLNLRPFPASGAELDRGSACAASRSRP
jgi:hypothetical protein